MNSPFGVRGVILERFGWTYDYLMHEIPWLDVHFMMVDAPRFVPDPVKDDGSPAKNNNTPSNIDEVKKPQSAGDKLNNLISKYI